MFYTMYCIFMNVLCDLYTKFNVHFIYLKKKAFHFCHVAFSIFRFSYTCLCFSLTHIHTLALWLTISPQSPPIPNLMSVHCRVPQLRSKAIPTRIIIILSDICCFLFDLLSNPQQYKNTINAIDAAH